MKSVSYLSNFTSKCQDVLSLITKYNKTILKISRYNFKYIFYLNFKYS